MTAHQRWTRRLASVGIGTAALLMAGGIAYAAWSALGAGTGTAAVGAPQALGVSATVAGTLYPGASADILVTVSNPNSAPVTVQSLTLAGSVTASAGCSTPGVTVSLPATTTLVVPAGGNASLNVANAVSMTSALVIQLPGRHLHHPDPGQRTAAVNPIQRPAVRSTLRDPLAVRTITRRATGRRPVRVLLAAAVCVALGAVPAYAMWSVLGAGSTTATARSLVTPAAPSVGTPTVSSLVVSGTLPGGQVPSTTYAVKRGATTVCTPTATPWSCTDSGLTASTTYSYTVVAAIGSWIAASSATSGTTNTPPCTGPDTYTVSVPAITAGTAATVTLTAKKCDGTVDTAYTGSKVLTWAAVAASPSGKAAILPATATFASGTASVSVLLYAAGNATLTPTSGTVTGSATTTVTAGVAKNFVLSSVTSKGAPVTVTCLALTDPSTARSCLATDPGENGKHDWVATANLLDTWGNPATTPTALTVTATRAGGTSTATIAAGTGATSSQLTISIGNGETVSIAFTATGISSLTVTNAT